MIITPILRRELLLGGSSSFTPGAVTFDGTNDACSVTFTGPVDSRTGAVHFVIDLTGGDGVLMRLVNSSNSRVLFARQTTNKFTFTVANVGGTSTLAWETVNTYTAANGFLSVVAEWDTNFAAGSKVARCYVNGVSDSTITADAAAAFDIDYTDYPYGIMARANAANKLNGTAALLWFATGQFPNLSANISKFYAGGKVVDPGPTGTLPTGTPPIAYYTVFPGQVATAFATDRSGNSNTLTITGDISPVVVGPNG